MLFSAKKYTVAFVVVFPSHPHSFPQGVKKLKLNVKPKQIVAFLRYADPNCDGDLTWGELEIAIKKLEETEGGLAAAAGRTLNKFEKHMVSETPFSPRLISWFGSWDLGFGIWDWGFGHTKTDSSAFQSHL